MKSLDSKIQEYIPVNIINCHPSVYWASKLIEIYDSKPNEMSMNNYELRQYYLNTVKEVEPNLYDSHQYLVKYSNKNPIKFFSLPEDLVLALNPRGISIYSNKRVI